MDMKRMLSELHFAGKKTETSFLSLSDIFPQLLAVRDNIKSGDLSERISALQNESSAFGALSGDFWNGREEAYTPMLEKLNEKVSALSELEQDVKTIRECSEEMELLSLNAIVISINAGARGRAFSSITESLRSLSSKMIESSSRLVREQGHLIESIRELGDIISSLSATQRKELFVCNAGRAGLQDILQSIGRPLPEIEAKAGEVWEYIAKSMETIQMQDIVKQSAAQVILCLKEFKDYSELSKADTSRRNDIICFDIQLCKIALEILKDISLRLEECIKIFSADWDSLQEILETVEKMRKGFINSFYSDTAGQMSLSSRLDHALEQFRLLLDGFFNYQNEQKSLVKHCTSIKTHSRSIFTVFMDLLPVVNSLHHVRVLQKIEIAKNDAISSVQNSADNMDTFVNRSKDTIDGMSTMLENFLSESDKLLSDFISEVTQTGEVASELKSTGWEFFARLKDAQNELEKTLKTYMVFPRDFDNKCANVRAHLESIVAAAASYMSLSDELSHEAERLAVLQSEEFERAGISSWQLEDNTFKEIIDRFTITLHKKLAGSITGVAVESGIKSGEVTFF